MSSTLKSTHRKDIFYVRTVEDPDAIPELSVVELTSPARGMDDAYFPTGTIGTVVAVWDSGAAYEVEFSSPVGSLATVSKTGLRLVTAMT